MADAKKMRVDENSAGGAEQLLDHDIMMASFSSFESRVIPKRAMQGVCRKISDYEKINRLGEGTYGVVCKLMRTCDAVN